MLVEHVRPRRPLAVPGAGALPWIREVTVRSKIHQQRLYAVVVAAAWPYGVGGLNVLGGRPRRLRVEEQAVPRAVGCEVRQVGELLEVRDDLVDDRGPGKVLAPPRPLVPSPGREPPRRSTDPIGGTVTDRFRFAEREGGRAAAKRAAHALAGRVERALQPQIERLPEYTVRLGFGQHAESRVDASFDRPLP